VVRLGFKAEVSFRGKVQEEVGLRLCLGLRSKVKV